jgi:Uma2 family endonuclease
MATQLRPAERPETVYPESDGQPMADNTLQFEWIVTIKGNLDALFRDDPNVFVAGDLLWYPVEGDNLTRVAPGVLVAFGRPKGYRGAYLPWREDDIAPQVVFEIRSPGNRLGEMLRKRDFYERHGVEEYYLYDPDRFDLTGWIRAEDGNLRLLETINGWISPRLGIRFEAPEDAPMILYRPDGQRFLTFIELEAERQRAEAERARAEQGRQHAEEERARAEAERDEARERAARLAARLREAGLDPDGE